MAVVNMTPRPFSFIHTPCCTPPLATANVYDINPKTYVLKLARSGEDGEKALLLIESGVRLHTVEVCVGGGRGEVGGRGS